MSQSQHPKDTQALVQSMLQRLKLQPGRESQAYLHTPEPIATGPTWGQDCGGESPDLQKIKKDIGENGIQSIVSGDIHVGLKGGQTNGGLVSSHSLSNKFSSETGENTVLDQTTPPGVTAVSCSSTQGVDIASLQRTDGETVSLDSSSMTKNSTTNTDAAPNAKADQVFTPRVYVWSLKGTDINTGSQQNEGQHVGNGELGASAQTRVNSFRKIQLPENKTKRWTARIKEKWKQKGKEKEDERITTQKNAQGTEVAATNQVILENPFDMSNEDGEETLSSLDSSDTPAAHSGDNDGRIRSTSDFEFGLGSFSLLDEIVKGQEWAKFLNPNKSAAPGYQASSQQLLVPLNVQSNLYNINQPPGVFTHGAAGSNKWSFTSSASPPFFTAAEIPPDAFQPVSMSVTEANHQQQSVQTEVDQSEPMEDGQNLSDMQSQQEQMNPPSFEESAARVQGVLVRSRLQLNRKRHHQPAERRNERPQTEGVNDEEEAGPVSMMDESGGSRPESVMTSSRPSPRSPSFFSPTAPAPRGVLKHSISHGSQSSMETLSKKRRVEENRHVRFSEEVFTIESPELNFEIADSDKDSEEEEEEEGEEEENTDTEQENKVERELMHEAAPARRPALPNWILALKRRNTGKKPT